MIDMRNDISLSVPQPTRLIFITRTFPRDFNTATYGIYIRMRLLLEASQSLADHLDILFFVDPSVKVTEELRANTEAELKKRWGILATVRLAAEQPISSDRSYWNHYISPAISFFRNADYAGTAGTDQIRAFEGCLDSHVSFIVVHRLGAMCPILLSSAPIPPIFFDLDDVEHRKLMRDLKQPPFYPGKLFGYLKALALLRGERAAVRRARKTFLCSQSDKRYLSRFIPSDSLVEIPNTVMHPPAPAPRATTESILFLGSFTYGPNVDAAEYLITKVWPIVKVLRPNARLFIAGQRPERIPSFHSSQADVVFTGFVQDLNVLYSTVRLVCCPILSGGGTRIKIIEAACYGRPVVSTTIGAEGLAFVHAEEIWLADSVAAFAEACAKFLDDQELACQMGQKARQRALLTYDRNVILARLRDTIRTGMQEKVSRMATS